MKKFSILSMMLLSLTMLPMIVACGGDDNDDIVIVQEPQVSLNASNLTEYGYFDGLLYYKILSNSTQEVEVVKAEKNAVNVTIPSQVNIEGKTYKCTRIGGFNKCSNLTSITIPNSITEFNGSFTNCYKIEKFISLIENPFPFIEIEVINYAGMTVTAHHEIFNKKTYENATLYVPKGTKGKYMNTEGWKNFNQIKEGNGK